jgi:transcriptional regulator with GAF, ATPase, and Fis domain
MDRPADTARAEAALEAAARLGLNLRQMRYRIQRLGIVVPGSDDAD